MSINKKWGEEEKSTVNCILQRVLLSCDAPAYPHALLSLLFVLAFVCSSCRAGELAALLLRFWQIKRLAQALRLISCSADVHRRRNT